MVYIDKKGKVHMYEKRPKSPANTKFNQLKGYHQQQVASGSVPGITSPGSTGGLFPFSPYDPTLNNLPPLSGYYELRNTTTIAHHATDTIRIQMLVDLSLYAVIDDETARSYDRFDANLMICGSEVGFSQTFHFAIVKGPAAMTFTAGDFPPNSTLWKDALETTLTGGSEISYLPTAVLKPYRDGAGNLRCEKVIAMDLKDHVNRFLGETEVAIAQGRTVGNFCIVIITNGKASTSDTIYTTWRIAYHDRNRRLKT